MDSARQVIRWALPGWLFFWYIFLFFFINSFLSGRLQHAYPELLNKMIDLILPLGVASIPIGFMIYQTYHFIYWFAPIPSILDRRFHNPVDRGVIILSNLVDQIEVENYFDRNILETPESPFIRKGFLKIKSAKIMEKYRINWHLSDSFWYLALSNEKFSKVSDHIERRNQFLSDIYHSLGACYNSIILSFVFYTILVISITIVSIITSVKISFSSISKIRNEDLSFVMMMTFFALIINLVILIVSLIVFKGGRVASFDALCVLKQDIITNAILNKPKSSIIQDNDISI